jgi:F-type H+-transporting ATPase subunit epsilon
MQVTLISAERSLFHGEADAVVAPAFDGQVGILPRHAPFMTLLGEGEVKLRQGDSETRFQVSGGFLQVSGNAVRIVAGRAAPAPA